MRIAAIVQRYGAEIVGGAESLCRGVAEGLAGRDHEVEVLTTCARSYVTWANAFGEGIEKVNGVRVRRFRVEHEREMDAFNTRSAELLGKPHSIEDEEAWVESQGPYAPRLVDHLHQVARDFDRFVFFTYLYHPTVHGIHVAPRRSVLVPTAHDEAPIYLKIFDAVFALPAGVIFNTDAEADFVRRRFPRLPAKSGVVGVGIDNLEELEAAGQEESGASEAKDPVLLYAGRIEPGKGVGKMLDHLRRYRRETGVEVRTWLMGEVAMEVPDEDWIEVLGFVSDEEKVRRMRDATVLVAPSPLESFGIVVLEAMAAGTPALVNADSAAAMEHCRRANGGLFYRGYPELREALDLLLTDARLRRTMAKEGASYVRENYSWPKIVSRYEAFLESL